MMAGNNEGCQIMVFTPSYEEFKDFSGYIRYMESKGAHKAGIAKVIPPKEWQAVRRYNMKRIGEMEIKTPIQQTVSGQQGLFQLINIQKKTMQVKNLKELAETPKHKPPEGSIDELERKFWKNITFNPSIYGADVPGTIYDKDVKHWNINSLNTILDTLNSDCSVKILGVNTAYLYFGMWKACFPWHTEDMDLYSINYLHHGAPKFWYSIPPEHGKRLETLAKGFFSGSAQDCSEFMRHKMTLISPQILRKFSIPVNKIVHNEGEFMVTFPYGYHAGFNLGFNIAESTNFASERWIEFGKKAKHCQCNRDSVKINMDVFIKKFQPEEWKRIQQKRIEEKQANKKKHNNLSSSSSDSSSQEENSEEEDDEEDDDVSSDEEEKEEEIIDTETEEEIPLSSSEEYSENLARVAKKQYRKPDSETRTSPKSVVKKHKQIKQKRTSKRQRIKKRLHGESSEDEKEIKKENKHNGTDSKKPLKINLSSAQRAMNLKSIWKFEDEKKNAEITYNRTLSETETKCAICVFFSQRDAEYLHGEQAEESNKRHTLTELKCGKLLVTELCFAANNSEEDTIETAFNLMFGADGEQQDVKLLFCAKCHVAVHSVCYGVDMTNNNNNNNNRYTKWYCQKCQHLQQQNAVQQNFFKKEETESGIDEIVDVTSQACSVEELETDITCCLCMMRGGALKRTTCGNWCHVVCAIALPEVFFEDKQRRDGINITKLNPARQKLHCIYCSHLKKPSSSITSSCVQCQCGKCATPFHVTCSLHNGIPLYLGDWPLLIETLCSKHSKRAKNNVEKTNKRELQSITMGDLVYAKHKNGRYYQGRVITVSTVLYYKVIFADKSFCFDLPPEDIQNVDAKNQVQADGTSVDVLWTDSLSYPAEVTGHWYDTVSQVRFEDASILNVKRADLFIDGEDIPKRVKSKISYATETQNKSYFPESLRHGTNRPRVGVRKCQSVHKKL